MIFSFFREKIFSCAFVPLTKAQRKSDLWFYTFP